MPKPKRSRLTASLYREIRGSLEVMTWAGRPLSRGLAPPCEAELPEPPATMLPVAPTRRTSYADWGKETRVEMTEHVEKVKMAIVDIRSAKPQDCVCPIIAENHGVTPFIP